MNLTNNGDTLTNNGASANKFFPIEIRLLTQELQDTILFLLFNHETTDFKNNKYKVIINLKIKNDNPDWLIREVLIYDYIVVNLKYECNSNNSEKGIVECTSPTGIFEDGKFFYLKHVNIFSVTNSELNIVACSNHLKSVRFFNNFNDNDENNSAIHFAHAFFYTLVPELLHQISYKMSRKVLGFTE